MGLSDLKFCKRMFSRIIHSISFVSCCAGKMSYIADRFVLSEPSPTLEAFQDLPQSVPSKRPSLKSAAMFNFYKASALPALLGSTGCLIQADSSPTIRGLLAGMVERMMQRSGIPSCIRFQSSVSIIATRQGELDVGRVFTDH